eukprot:13807568-Ditylum_brightwellii.AAC.1
MAHHCWYLWIVWYDDSHLSWRRNHCCCCCFHQRMTAYFFLSFDSVDPLTVDGLDLDLNDDQEEEEEVPFLTLEELHI